LIGLELAPYIGIRRVRAGRAYNCAWATLYYCFKEYETFDKNVFSLKRIF